ncbi:MAG: formyltransferase, partial [Burkholderiales bacterium]|nr:formyltransferase [Burkholderiales bacterium]
ILKNDTAIEVFHKVTCASEIVLHRALPKLLDGSAVPVKQDLSKGGYFGGRSARDGEIDWKKSACEIHNLVRAVAPPYPGAHSTISGTRLSIYGTLVENRPTRHASASIYCENGRCYAECGGGGVLRLISFELDGAPGDAQAFADRFGHSPITLS